MQCDAGERRTSPERKKNQRRGLTAGPKTPTLPTSREGSGTRNQQLSEKAGPPSHEGSAFRPRRSPPPVRPLRPLSSRRIKSLSRVLRGNLHFGPIRPSAPQCRCRLSNPKFQILNCFASLRPTSSLDTQASRLAQGVAGNRRESAGNKAPGSQMPSRKLHRSLPEKRGTHYFKIDGARCATGQL